MTPLQFAQQECANHQPDGSCLGAVIEEDLSIRRCSPRPRCRLADGERCGYFEACVAPLARMVTDPWRAAALRDAVTQYHLTTRQPAEADRNCPDCGRPMAKGRRYCPTCAAVRRKVANRTAQSRHRQNEVGMSAVIQKYPPKSLGFSSASSEVFRNAIGDSHPPQNGATTADIGAGRIGP